MSRWHELVVEGPERLVRAFTVGFAAGRAKADEVVFGADCAIEPASLGERLRELFGAGSHHLVLAPEALAVPLAEALRAHGGAVGLALDDRRVVDAASFTFRAEIFARPLALEVRGLLVDALPTGVRVEALSEEEETHPEARGPEPFAPLHDYAYRLSGRVVGPLPGVLAVRRRAAEHEVVQLGPLELGGPRRG